jgi:hypothetical protein
MLAMLDRFPWDGAALILLDLLECEPDSIAQLGLAHRKQRAALAHARSNMNVNGV